MDKSLLVHLEMGFDLDIHGNDEVHGSVHMFYSTWDKIVAFVGLDKEKELNDFWDNEACKAILVKFQAAHKKLLDKIRKDCDDSEDEGEQPQWSGPLGLAPEWLVDRYELDKIKRIIETLEECIKHPECYIDYG